MGFFLSVKNVALLSIASNLLSGLYQDKRACSRNGGDAQSSALLMAGEELGCCQCEENKVHGCLVFIISHPGYGNPQRQQGFFSFFLACDVLDDVSSSRKLLKGFEMAVV